MKELLLQYALYNIWANDLVIKTLLHQPEMSINRDINSSFRSIMATVTHCWSAEDIWLQRLMKAENTTWAESIFKGSFEDACLNWQVISRGLEVFVKKQAETSFSNDLTYHDRQQRPYTMPVFQVLLHVFNHSTYHRGQLITMLRQVGEDKLPQTDFIAFAKENVMQ